MRPWRRRRDPEPLPMPAEPPEVDEREPWDEPSERLLESAHRDDWHRLETLLHVEMAATAGDDPE
jgi:hypothetical protein